MRIFILIFLLASYFVSSAEFDSTKLFYDYIPDATYDEIADRIDCLDTTIPLSFNKTVRGFVDYFTVRNRDYTRGILNRKDYFFDIIEPYLKKYDLPDDLKYLSIVESGLIPTATSWASAVGLWQFIPSTGRTYGLSNSWYIDERMDPYKSTDAACRYLKDLHTTFGRWDLALAAYNCGPGNVRKAIRRSGYKTNFWEIYYYLPRETRSYIPQFIAIIYALNYAEEHNLYADFPYHLPNADTLMVSQYFHLETFATQANICMDHLLELNPSIRRGALPVGVKNFVIKVPSDMKASIDEHRSLLFDTAGSVGLKELEQFASHTPGSTYGRVKEVYRVRSGDVLGNIAGRYHVRVSDIQKWNNLSSTMIRVGQNLTIWSALNYSPSSSKLSVSTKSADQTIVGDTYLVRPGDSLWSISKNSNVSIDQIKKINKLNSNVIQSGQKLIISID
jgi:membrane-bound lytic murein transglycosylase D